MFSDNDRDSLVLRLQSSAVAHRSASRVTAAGLLKLVTGTALLAFLSACRIQIEVPPGGQVITESKAYRCLPRNTCEIDVVDQFFKETFVAKPNKGFAFMGWEKVPSAFCGDSYSPCALSTEDFGLYPNLLAVLTSDRVFYLKPKFAPIPTIGQEDLKALGNVVDTDNGIDLSGSLELNTGKGPKRLFKDANLKLAFNAEGDLEKLDGEGILPRDLTRKFKVNTDVVAQIGYFTGKQINDDDEIDIHLREERQYLVFLLGESFSYSFETLTPGTGSTPTVEEKEATIDTPAGGKIIVILDPNDDMLYRYGENPLLGAFGEAESDQGLIPYVPYIEGNAKVYRFDGHLYKTISVGVGIKALDVLNLTGEQITYQPSLFDIDLSDPFNSPVAYKAGYNGAVEVAMSVFGFSIRDYFQFDLAEASGSFEVSKNRQIMTLASEVTPDVSWAPPWLPIFPTTSLAFDLTAKGNGSAVINLSGSYESELPPANIEGSMRISPQSLTLKGTVVGRQTLPISVKFEDGDTFGTVGITADFSELVKAQLAGGFDRAEDEVTRALKDLEQAAADYEFELSLRGLRSSLPGIADVVVAQLQKVPGIVYDEVYKRVKDGIDDRNPCALGVCLISTSTRNSKARSAASTARDVAESRIAPYIASMRELKRSALEDDNEQLIASLEAALRAAYAKRTFKETFKVTVSVAGISVTKSYTVSRTILTSSQATAVLNAAENIHLIPETSDRVVSARQIIDRLPTQQIIDQARQSVEDELVAVPAVKAVTYAIIDGEYSAAVQLSNGSSYDVEFNVLDWQEVSAGIADLLADYVIERF